VIPQSFTKLLLEKSTLLEATTKQLEEIFVIDNNYSPARYVLLPSATAEKLKNLAVYLAHDLETVSINHIVFPLEDGSHDDIHCLFGQSVVEWATKHVFGSKPLADRSLWCRKEFLHRGHEDRSKLVKVDGLASWMKHKLPKQNTLNINMSVYREIYLEKDNVVTWGEIWEREVTDALMPRLKDTTASRIAWQQHGHGLNIPGSVLDEMLHHSYWACMRSQGFIGRQAVLKELCDLCCGSNSIARESKDNKRAAFLRGTTVAVVGKHGVGKSALLSKLADTIYRTQSTPNRPVIIRFCGTTWAAKSALPLVISICHQINLCIGAAYSDVINSYSYAKAVKCLHALLTENPVVLILDGINELSNLNLAKTDLTFLHGLVPHQDTRIILSTDPDSDITEYSTTPRAGGISYKMSIKGVDTPAANTAATSKRSNKDVEVGDDDEEEAVAPTPVPAGPMSHGCESKLRAANVPILSLDNDICETPQTPVVIAEVKSDASKKEEGSKKEDGSKKESVVTGPAISSMARDIVSRHLEGQGRVLTDAQWEVVLSQADVSCQLPVLYWVMAALVVRQWTDIEGSEASNYSSLPKGLDAIINEYFGNMEAELGQLFVSTVFGIIALSVNGVLESQLLDLLASSDDIVASLRADTNSEGGSNVDTSDAPLMIANKWARLKCRYNDGVMSKILIETCSNGGSIRFVHSHVRLVFVRRLASLQATEIHRLRAVYYGNLLPKATLQQRRILAQPMVLNDLDPKLPPVALFDTPFQNQTDSSTARKTDGQTTGRKSDGQMTGRKSDGQTTARKSESTTPSATARRPDPHTNNAVNIVNTGNADASFVKNSTPVWFATAIVNSHRCIEAPHAMLGANMVNEAVTELCNIEYCVARVRAGYTTELINYLADLAHLLTNTEDSLSIRVQHYLRFVLQFAEFEDCAYPVQHLLTTALLQPMNSCVRLDANELYSSKYETVSEFTNQHWIRCREFGMGHDSDDLIATFHGHTKNVLSVDISQDGRTIASSSDDGTIRYWDAYTSECLHLMEGHKGAVYSVAFNNPVANRIVSGGRDRLANVWEVESGLCLLTLSGHNDCVQCVCYNQSGTMIATGSKDRTVMLWDSVSGNNMATLDRHSGVITCLAFMKTSDMLLSGSEDDSICLWDTTTQTVVKSYAGHTKAVTSLSVNGDGSKFVSASRDKCIRVWDTETGQTLSVLERHSNRVTSVSINTTGTRIVSACDDNHILLWDTASCEVIKSFLHQPVTAVKFSHAGDRFVSGSFVKTVNLWDVSAHASFEQSLKTVNSSSTVEQMSKFEKVAHCVLSICFSDSGRWIVSGNAEHTIYVWDSATGILHSVLGNGETEHEGPVTSVCCVTVVPETISSKHATDSDKSVQPQQHVISGSSDHTVKIWDLFTGELLSSLQLETVVTTVCVNRQGTTLVVGAENKDILVYDYPNHNETPRVACVGHLDVALCSTFTGDGKTLTVGTENFSIHNFNPVTGVQTRVFMGHTNRVNCVCYSRDSAYLVSGSSDKTIRVWDTRIVPKKKDKDADDEDEELDKPLILTGHAVSITAVAVANFDNYVVSSSVDKSVRIWDLHTGELLNTLLGHTNKVTCLSVSSNGCLIVSGSADKSVRVWDASNGKLNMMIDSIY
jgi:WD40 repeat protein